MISPGEARAIVYGLDPSRLVRLAYRAASTATTTTTAAAADGSTPIGDSRGDSGREAFPFRIAAVVLDLRDGGVRVKCWRGGGLPDEMPPHLVTLAYADTALVEDVSRRYGEGCELPPSPEVLEECLARDVAADGLGVSWQLFESQIDAAYDDFDPDALRDDPRYHGPHGPHGHHDHEGSR